jgi:hypothetical protein
MSLIKAMNFYSTKSMIFGYINFKEKKVTQKGHLNQVAFLFYLLPIAKH